MPRSLKTLLVGGGQQHMLHRHVFVLEPLGFVLGFGQQVLQPLRDVNLVQAAARTGNFRKTVELLLKRPVRGLEIHARLGQNRLRESALLLEQRKQQMLDVKLLLPMPGGQRLSGS